METWADRPRVVLLDAVAQILTEGVCRWAGLPLPDDGTGPLTADLVAMVDGFATPGPRHWRARLARRRRETWIAAIVDQVRSGTAGLPPDCVVERVALHRDLDGDLLASRVAAVEVLNIIRPTVAVCWFMVFVAHALHRWPDTRTKLAGGDAQYTRAFVQEIRRFYPFAPFVGGTAATDLFYQGEPIPEGTMVLLDLYGQNHDPDLWKDPYEFRPERFLRHPGDVDQLIPQGGGDPATGHRCPGEAVVIGLLEALSQRLALLDYTLPSQDLSIPLGRMIARPRSGFVIEAVHRV
ncbi:cytochrome P450 [Kitasatospora sp. NPDC085895]|uniref:cytochrome P450 n=1 Tax=Kitasatospora sp. NPDC085895 TaxID=3155057 RepID=UPI003450790E